MTKIVLCSLVLCYLILPFFSFSQIGNKPLFQNAYSGFATGFYPAGQSPTEVKAGDLDNDGDSDLVVAQQSYAAGFAVLINQGNHTGNYALPVQYKAPKAAQGIVVADFNKDGFKDVALTNSGQNLDGQSVSLFFNTGAKGKFGAPINYTVGAYPNGITAADFDNDGDQDIAVCNNLSDSNHAVSVLINKGNGTFNPAINIAAGDKPYRIEAAYINNDNLVDLIVGNNTQNVTILFNGGGNNFSSRRTLNVLYTYPVEDANATVRTADFDNDGDNDIIFSSAFTNNGSNGQVALFSNKGNGTFTASQLINLAPNTIGASYIDVADFNSDGKMDIIAANFSGRTDDGYEIVLNNGNNNFALPTIKPAGQSTKFVTAADVNNDGKTDVITSDDYSLEVTVHRNAGNASFPIPPMFATNSSSAGSLDTADIDGDGDLDVVSSASSVGAVGSTVTVLKNNGNGTFSPGIAYSIRGGGVQAKFRDLNGDGKPDLIFATAIDTPPYDFHTAINNGNGTFGARQTWSMNACGWSDIEAIDVDNDGDNDAVITEWLGCRNVDNSSRRLFISKNNGKGVFAAPIIKLINPSPSCIAAGDLNKDGKIDIVTGHFLSVDIHLNSGNSSIFKAPVSYTTSESPYDIILVDVNKDGNLDIAACTEYVHESMSVLLGNGDGTFKPAQNYNGALSPDLRNESGITSGDVDGDGDVDLLVGNYGSNDVSLYLNKGDGTFIFKARTGMYYGVESPIYADFTGDGKKDLIALVSLPPSGVQNALAILKGNIANADTPLSARPLAKRMPADSSTDAPAADIKVLNNPFANYIDVNLDGTAHGKLKLALTDIAGRQIAGSEVANNMQTTYRFHLENKNIKAGIYLLIVEVNGTKYTAKVLHR